MHTEFSIKDGMLNPKKVVHKAIASGMKALAITDATAMFGDVIFYKAASAAGIKPILGADCSITNHYNRDDYLRLLFLARNHQGYLTLCDLLSRAWLTNQYKDRGEVDLDWITPEMADGLIVLSGFNTGAIGKAILNGSLSAAEQEARRLSQKFPHFFMELQRVGARMTKCSSPNPSSSPRNSGCRLLLLSRFSLRTRKILNSMKLAWRLPTASRWQIRLVLVFTRLSSISVRKKKCASSSKTFLLRLKTALKLQNAAMSRSNSGNRSCRFSRRPTVCLSKTTWHSSRARA